MIDFNKFADECYNVALHNGFHDTDLHVDTWIDDPNRLCSLLMLVNTELCEAVEAIRKEDFDNFIEEIADAFIRLGDVAGLMGLDIDARIKSKMEENKGRGWRHGGKRI